MNTSFIHSINHSFTSWLYRLKPSVGHVPFEESKHYGIIPNFTDEHTVATPNQLRWSPYPFPKESTNFVEGIRTLCGSGSPQSRNGLSVLIYTGNADMDRESFSNSDGDMLIGNFDY